MFDTAVVRAHSTAAPRPWAPLTLSLVFHTLAVAAVLFFTVTATSLPADPPDQFQQYQPEVLPAVPPPLGRPDAPRAAQPAAATPARQVVPPGQVTAPPIVPDQVPAQQSGAGDVTGGATGASTATEDGRGTPDGVAGGVGEPTADLRPAIAQSHENVPLWPRGEVRPARVLSRVEPRYPDAFTAVRLREVTVVIRCVVDRHGQVRDAEVVRGAFAPFNDAALEALRQWRFAPGSLRGQAVDTWFELTVSFQMR